MGMFDYVEYEAPCYKCGHILTEWQSKDGPCLLEDLTISDVSYFYESCSKCSAWNEYNVEPARVLRAVRSTRRDNE